MAKLNERNCAHCGKLYSLLYTPPKGHPCTLNTIYCSKSCSTSAQRSVTVEDLKNKAIDFISQKGSYCTAEELCNGIRHSSKTFTKHGLKTSELNAEAGMIKPKSKFQGSVGEVLKNTFDVVENEKTFDGLVGVKGHPLRVDFYLPEINTVVEADGSQHSDPKHPWKEWNNGTVAQYDKIKDDYFAKKGIRLVRVPYKPSVKESDVLSRLA